MSRVRNEIMESKGNFTVNTQPDSLTKQEAESPAYINNVPRVPRLNSPFTNFPRDNLRLKNTPRIMKIDLFMNSPLKLKSAAFPQNISSIKSPTPLKLRSAKDINTFALPASNMKSNGGHLRQFDCQVTCGEREGEGRHTERPRPATKLAGQLNYGRSKETPTAKPVFYSPNYNNQQFNGFSHGIASLKIAGRAAIFERSPDEYDTGNRGERQQLGTENYISGNPELVKVNEYNGNRLLRSTSSPHRPIFSVNPPQQAAQNFVQTGINRESLDVRPFRKTMHIFDSEFAPTFQGSTFEKRTAQKIELAHSEARNSTPRVAMPFNISNGLQLGSHFVKTSNGVTSGDNVLNTEAAKEYQNTRLSQSTHIQPSDHQFSGGFQTYTNLVNHQVSNIRADASRNTFVSFVPSQSIAPQRVTTPLSQLSRVENPANPFDRQPTFHGSTTPVGAPSGHWTSPGLSPQPGGLLPQQQSAGQHLWTGQSQLHSSGAFSFSGNRYQ